MVTQNVLSAHLRIPLLSQYKFLLSIGLVLWLLLSNYAYAQNWRDTWITVRSGTQFAEPFNNKSVGKNIVGFAHAESGKYGTLFFNLDFLQSDKNDPAAGDGGAREAYLVFRNTFDFEKISGTPVSFTGVRGAGLTIGFDANTKNDVSYQSRKHMLVVGPTLMLDVSGWMNVDLLLLSESNFPQGIAGRYTYKTHFALGAQWATPLGNAASFPLSFEGYGLLISQKSINEFGGSTAPETNIDMYLMADVAQLFRGNKKSARIGLGYQYWKNKFGTPASVPGSLANTWMLRADFHF